jgi:hypothetical protein
MPIMKIDSASYSLAASHLVTRHDESTESLRVWKGNRQPDFEAGGNATTPVVLLSTAARALLAADSRATMAAPPAQPEQTQGGAAIEEAADAVDSDPSLMLIRSMVEMLTGHRIKVFSARKLQPAHATPSITGPETAAPRQAAPARSAGFGLEYDYHAVHEEFEQTQVSAEGWVKTADGQEISFTLDLSMTRSYREETSLSLRFGAAARRDPLVLNFNGTAAQLCDRRFSFDLDYNGSVENLALLTGGSGYLAIDHNGNGRIDSGHELFGPATNSGFGELAALDSDGNRWIDENDVAFDALRIWTPSAEGEGTLEPLAQRKVGAIGLDHIDSPFELRGAGNSNLGAIAASGVFLAEDGRAGNIQELDLAV